MNFQYSEQQDEEARPQRQASRTAEERVDSVFLAKELVLGDKSQFAKRLIQYKEIKNPNYDKFTEKITTNLKNHRVSFSRSRDTFKDISRSANIENTTGHQLGAILQGFNNHWKNCQIAEPFEEIRSLFAFIPLTYVHIHSKFATCCSELIKNHCKSLEDQQYFKEEALKMAETMLKTPENYQRILPLVYEFDLYRKFSLTKIAELVFISRNPNEVAYIFRASDAEVCKELMKLFIDKCIKNDDTKKCQSIIKKLEIDPFDFPLLIQRLQQKNLNYQMRTNKLYFIELVVRGDLSLLRILVRLLKRSGRDRDAKYFAVKYGLNENEYSIKYMSEKEKEEIKNIVNVLQVEDRFGPTEIEVLLQKEGDSFIYLREFGLNYEDVTFVDRSNIGAIKEQEVFAKKRIGFDSENVGGVHVFDQPRMTIIQVYSGKHIFIFDYTDLKENDRFKEIIVYLFTYCKIYGHDHVKELTVMQRELQLDIKEEVMQQLMRNRMTDTNKLYKTFNPKDNKSNLVHICEMLIGKPISKFEQCSGWAQRPLRKAQLHYASLDCVLPLNLGRKMEKQLRPSR